MKSIQRELRAWLDALVSALPGAVGRRLRAAWYGRTLAALGPGGSFGPGVLVIGGPRIRIGARFSCWRSCTLAACENGVLVIGNNVSLNANVYVNACGGRISIGHDVMVGPNVVLRSSDHVTADRDTLIRLQGHTAEEIVIDDDVWLAANVTVVGGVHIGRGAVVAANAVVTRDVAPFTIVGGVPARPIGVRGAPVSS